MSTSGPLPEDVFVCQNCAADSRGRYCWRCGQQRVSAGDLGLRHFWRHVVSEVLDVDGRIFTTLKVLFTKPGQLTVDFLEGRRARFIHPVRLFVVFAAAFFLIRASSLSFTQVAPASSLPAIEARLHARAAGEGVPYDVVAARVDERLVLAYKAAYVGSVVLSGVWLWVLFHRRRRYLGEHMIAALHMACVAMTVAVAAGWLAPRLGRLGTLGPVRLGTPLMLPFLDHALERVYGTENSRAHALVIGLVLWVVLPELALRGALRWLA